MTKQQIAEAIWNDLASWEKSDYDMEEIIELLDTDPYEIVKFLVDRFIVPIEA